MSCVGYSVQVLGVGLPSINLHTLDCSSSETLGSTDDNYRPYGPIGFPEYQQLVTAQKSEDINYIAAEA
jgi:hypothetical protein